MPDEPPPDEPFELITMGRVSVDIYPRQVGVPLEDVESFGRYLGGSPTNVAVAAARYGRRAAVVTRVGADPFGRFVREALRGYGVDDRFVAEVPGLPTPLAFCEIHPPDRFPLYFYRYPKAPDMQIRAPELDLAALGAARIFWATVTGLAEEPSREATLAALAAHRHTTVLDLDYRPMFWPDPAEAGRWAAEALRHATVAIGNLDECEVAVGEREPFAAARGLLDRGVELAIVKQGPDGVLAVTRAEAVEVPPVEVEVVNGLGAGDAFGGAVCHGLLAGWDLARTVRFANAAGAIVASRLACSAAMPDAGEVASLLGAEQERRSRSGGLRGRPQRGPASPGSFAGRYAELAELRATRPDAVLDAYRTRVRRERLLGPSGRLMLVAADHPARGALAAAGRPLAMADRCDLLERLVTALARPGVDGVLGTPDVIEDLLLLGALDSRVAIGSMNRGGLAGSAFEIDDRFTAYSAGAVAAARLDGGKMLLRIDPDDPATAAALAACGQAVSELAARERMALVEPFLSRREPGGPLRNVLTPEAMVRAVAVAAGLGTTSAYTWLKLPVVADMDRVVAASSLPVLLLGGESGVGEALPGWRKALALPSVRGLVAGRALLYPPGDDVAGAVDAAVELL